MSVEILLTAEHCYGKSHLKGLQYVNDLESDSKSSELPLFDTPLPISEWCVETTLSCVICEILPHIASDLEKF